MMANGTLVRVLIDTDVTKYLNFKAVDGSYVYNKGKVCHFWFCFSSLLFFLVYEMQHLELRFGQLFGYLL